MRTMIVFAVIVGMTSATWAQTAPAYPPPPPPPVQPQYGYPPPPQYGYPPPQPQYMQLQPPVIRYQRKPLYALIFTGVGIFGLGYIIDVFGTLVTSHGPSWECAVPVVGPMLQVNDRFDTDFRDAAKAFYVFDAILQTTGFVLTVVGASVWRDVPVRVAANGLMVRF
jgi:hypothetical protein